LNFIGFTTGGGLKLIFINVVLPIFLIFAAGYVLQKKFDMQMKELSEIVFYLLLPCLVFRTLYQVDIQGDLKYIVIFQIMLTIALVIIIKIIAYIKKMPPKMESAILLSAVFMNSGNYGAPFNLFAFGEMGFQLAITYWVIQSILMNSLGVYFANRHQASIKKSVVAVLRMPAVTAAFAGIGLQLLNWKVPDFLYNPIDFLSDATIPVIMILLGMQLAQVKLTKKWGPISLGLSLRLIISPLIAWAIVAFLLPVEGTLAKVLILEAAMPSAIVTTLLAVQYKCEPEVVSGVTLSTTIFSMVTLSILLYLVTSFL
jgi:predicted permease